MPGGSGQNHSSVMRGAVASAWRQRTERKVSPEWSSDPCLAAADRTKGQSGVEQ